MILQKRREAERLFREEGYNCAQAVAAAFCEETGISKEQSVTLVSGFGGGIGRLRETCGAVSGMVFVLSALYGNYDPKDQVAKKNLYRAVQEVCGAFSAKNGSVVCRTLLEGCQVTEGVTPEKRDTKAYQTRPCYTYVADAAEAVASFVAKHPIGKKLQFPD